MSDTRQAQREGWIEQTCKAMAEPYPGYFADKLRDAMAFADAHRERGQENVVRCQGCNAAQPLDDETGSCVSCGMPLIPTPPPREQGDE